MGTCKTCMHWDDEGRDKVDGGWCRSPKLHKCEDSDGLYAITGNLESESLKRLMGIVTGEDFGCIHHEAGDSRQ